MNPVGPCFFCGGPGTWCNVCKAYICSSPVCQARRVGHAVTNPQETVRKLIEAALGK